MSNLQVGHGACYPSNNAIHNISVSDDGKPMLRNGWLHCPRCSKIMMKIKPSDTINATVYCYDQKCKREFHVVVAQNTLYSITEAQ